MEILKNTTKTFRIVRVPAEIQIGHLRTQVRSVATRGSLLALKSLSSDDTIRVNTQIEFYNAMAVPTLTYGSEIWTITKKQEAKFETAEIKFLMSAAGYARKDQIRNTKIKEELDIFNINNKILKSKSQWKYHVQRMEGRADSEENFHITYKKKTKHKTPRVKMEGQAYPSRGRNRHEWPNPRR
jgi:hypothetical protein